MNHSRFSLVFLLQYLTKLYFNFQDVERFYDQVPNKILNYKVPFPEFNHLDYLWAIDADKYVYDKLVSEMENYR